MGKTSRWVILGSRPLTTFVGHILTLRRISRGFAWHVPKRLLSKSWAATHAMPEAFEDEDDYDRAGATPASSVLRAISPGRFGSENRARDQGARTVHEETPAQRRLPPYRVPRDYIVERLRGGGAPCAPAGTLLVLPKPG
jgi:hypothetical protein